MQRDGLVAVAGVLHAVQPELVAHVEDVVLLGVGGALLHEAAVVGQLRLRPVVAHLPEAAVKDLHEAVRVRVVVDRRLVALRPAEQHQVELSVALVDQVARIAVVVELGELAPVQRLRLVTGSYLMLYYRL